VKRLAALVVASGCIEPQMPGTLPGEAHSVLQASVGKVTADTVAADGTPTSVPGTLSTFRYSGGGYFAPPTRFGALSGAEVTTAFGYLSGDANTSHIYFDMEVGGLIQPFPFSSIAHLAVDFGVGFNLDDRYPYAGARGGVNLNSALSVDGNYRRHFGDVPGNVGAYEDRFGGVLTYRYSRDAAIQVGVEYTRGDQRTIVGGMATAAPDYLLQGKYSMLAFSIGYGFVAAKPTLPSVH